MLIQAYAHYNCASNAQIAFYFVSQAHDVRFTDFKETLSRSIAHTLASPAYTQLLYRNPVLLHLLLFGIITEAWEEETDHFCTLMHNQVSENLSLQLSNLYLTMRILC
jgi:hypothetical protein